MDFCDNTNSPTGTNMAELEMKEKLLVRKQTGALTLQKKIFLVSLKFKKEHC